MGVPRGGSLGSGVGGGVADGVPEKGLVVGVRVHVHVCFDLRHFGGKDVGQASGESAGCNGRGMRAQPEAMVERVEVAKLGPA